MQNQATYTENLKQIKAVLEKGWCQRHFSTGDGRYCFAGAMSNVTCSDTQTYYDLNELLTCIVRVKGFGTIVSYNDHPPRTKDDVLMVLQEAIETIEFLASGGALQEVQVQEQQPC